MVTLYNVISKDGFISRTDGGEDFIPDSYWPHTLAVMQQYDCIVLGRNTYETIQNYEKELRESFDRLPVKKVVVTFDKVYQVKEGYEVSSSPEEITQSGMNIVVTSGLILNNYFISNNLVDKITYHEVPVSIYEGIRPYNISSNEHIEIVKLGIPAQLRSEEC